MATLCSNCGKEVKGRSDKKFCDHYCKSSYHYKKSVEETGGLYGKIDKHLKLNRRLLKSYNRGGKATVRAQELLEKGFNPKYFTNFWKNKNGNVYFFVYEFGYMKGTQDNAGKYILIKWQEFMN